MDPWFVLPALALIAFVFVVLPVGLGTYFGYLRPKEVRCPADGKPAVVSIEAGVAAIAAVAGVRTSCVRSCTFWPARVNCDEACLDGPMHDLLAARRPV
jgi:hypothetical protein